MADKLPLKLIDLGSGVGRLAEFAVGDTIAGSSLGLMTGASTSAAGTPGAVPTPPAGPLLDYLARNGTFAALSDNPGLQGSQNLIQITSSNYNALTTNGRYYCFAPMTNAPGSSNYYVDVITTNPIYVKQIAYDIVSNSRFIRTCVAGAWGAWFNDTPGSGSTVGAWTNLSTYFASGTIAAISTPQYRINGDRVEFRGGVSKSGGFSGAGNSLLTMPAGLRPAYASGAITLGQVTLNTSGLTTIGALVIDSTGLMQYNISGGGLSGAGISLECLSYSTLA